MTEVINAVSSLTYIRLPRSLVGKMREKYSLRKKRNDIKFMTCIEELNLLF